MKIEGRIRTTEGEDGNTSRHLALYFCWRPQNQLFNGLNSVGLADRPLALLRTFGKVPQG